MYMHERKEWPDFTWNTEFIGRGIEDEVVKGKVFRPHHCGQRL